MSIDSTELGLAHVDSRILCQWPGSSVGGFLQLRGRHTASDIKRRNACFGAKGAINVYDYSRELDGSQQHAFAVTVTADSQLDEWIGDYVDGLQLHRSADCTVLAGELADLAAVYGLMVTLRDAGVGLLSLHVRRKTKGYAQS